jgi:hypothetical protein
MFERREPRSARGLPHLTANGFTQLGMSHRDPLHLRLMFNAFSSPEPLSASGENAMHYDSLPTDFSSNSQAWSPYLPFHSA